MTTHPFRLYNLYLCNFKAHQAKKNLANLISNFEDQLPKECLDALIEIKNQIKFLSELEALPTSIQEAAS